ncbi:MAG TPA: hypothetical protein VNX25_03010, partial [Verrucomicrobiae bacterium]|nr:hypothetical protein [Verrucomicrobiae bacterium]
QISLLAEHEVTRLVTLVRAIADRLGIEEAEDPELDELERDVHPEDVMEEMERSRGVEQQRAEAPDPQGVRGERHDH